MTPVIVNCDSGMSVVKVLAVVPILEGLALDPVEKWRIVGQVWKGVIVVEGLTQPCWHFGATDRVSEGNTHSKNAAIERLLAAQNMIEVRDLDTIPSLFD